MVMTMVLILMMTTIILLLTTRMMLIKQYIKHIRASSRNSRRYLWILLLRVLDGGKTRNRQKIKKYQ
jgi:hypothetical protein